VKQFTSMERKLLNVAIRCLAAKMHVVAWTTPKPPNTSVLGGFLYIGDPCRGALKCARPKS